MSNALFYAFNNETEPMYDIAVITDDGMEYYGTYICSLGDYADINGGFINTDKGMWCLRTKTA